MTSQETAVAEVAPRFQSQKSFEARSVDLLGSFQKQAAEGPLLVSPLPNRARLPKVKYGVPYNLFGTNGKLVGVVKIQDPVRTQNEFSVWVRYVDRKNRDRMQKLVFSPSLAGWFDAMTKLCCGGYCANPAHNQHAPTFTLKRRRMFGLSW